MIFEEKTCVYLTLPIILDPISIMICTVPLQVVIFCGLRGIQINVGKPGIFRAVKQFLHRNYLNFAAGMKLPAKHAGGRMKAPITAYPQKSGARRKFSNGLFQYDHGARFRTGDFVISRILRFLISTHHFVKMALWFDIKQALLIAHFDFTYRSISWGLMPLFLDLPAARCRCRMNCSCLPL